MGFRQADSEGRGGWARLWTVEDKGNYSVAKISTSRKRRDDEGYETDFQDGFVRLIGQAHEKAKTLNLTDKGVSIQITACEATTPYDPKTKKGYHNYSVFSFEVPDDDGASKKTGGSAKTTKKVTAKKPANVESDDDDTELPF